MKTKREQLIGMLIAFVADLKSNENFTITPHADKIINLFEPEWQEISDVSELPDGEIWITHKDETVTHFSGKFAKDINWDKQNKPTAYKPYIVPEPYKKPE